MDLNEKINSDYSQFLTVNRNGERKLYVGVGEGWSTLLIQLFKAIEAKGTQEQYYLKFVLEYNARIDEAEATGDWSTFPSFWYRNRKEIPVVPDKLQVTQIKEKFGGLRFYYTGGSDYYRGLVDLVENMSYHICDVCGHPGTLNQRSGWLRTRCEEHL